MTLIRGDKVRVMRIAEGFEEDGYAVGDVFEVHNVSTEYRDFASEEGAIITAMDGTELYEKEIELYVSEAEAAAKDADVSAYVKEEHVDEYNEIVIGLSQAIAMKAAQMLDNVDATYDHPSFYGEITLDEPLSAGTLMYNGEEVTKDTIKPHMFGGHGNHTPGKRAPEFDEWDDMPAVGKEIIYDDYNPDSVEHPSHYTQGKIEVIEIIAQTVSGYDDGFTAHCVGTATKYLNRAPHKHATPLEDLKKAAKYLEFAIKHEEGKE